MTDARDDRMPMPADAQLTPEQRRAVEEVAAGPRGRLLECFYPFLPVPELMRRVQSVGEQVRYGSGLDDRLFELVVLCVARFWNQHFEWSVHSPLAKAAGLSVATIHDVGVGRRPIEADPVVRAVFDLVRELQVERDVSDATWQRAFDLLGPESMAEVLATAGYYTLLAMAMNAAHTEGADRRLPERVGSDL